MNGRNLRKSLLRSDLGPNHVAVLEVATWWGAAPAAAAACTATIAMEAIHSLLAGPLPARGCARIPEAHHQGPHGIALAVTWHPAHHPWDHHLGAGHSRRRRRLRQLEAQGLRSTRCIQVPLSYRAQLHGTTEDILPTTLHLRGTCSHLGTSTVVHSRPPVFTTKVLDIREGHHHQGTALHL